MRKSVVCTDADVELVHAAPCVPACQRYVWGGCEICDAWRIRAGVTEPVQRHGQAESSHARYLAIRPYCSPGTDGYPTKIPSTSPSAPTGVLNTCKPTWRARSINFHSAAPTGGFCG